MPIDPKMANGCFLVYAYQILTYACLRAPWVYNCPQVLAGHVSECLIDHIMSLGGGSLGLNGGPLLQMKKYVSNNKPAVH